MNLSCVKCSVPFEAARFRAYCPDCVETFRRQRENIARAHRPKSGHFRDGKFAEPDQCPKTIQEPITGHVVCGLCGSDRLEQSYGLGSGYGFGMYTHCFGCNSVLDFVEEADEE